MLCLGLCTLSSLLFTTAHAQVARQDDTEVDYSPLFRRITTREGLSHPIVLAITQDAEGYLWFGTADGLVQYDGYEFVIYRPDASRPDSINDGRITSLVAAPDGLLWIGTFSGG